MSVEHKLLIKKQIIPMLQIMDYCCEQSINFELIDDNSLYISDWELLIKILLGEDEYICQSIEGISSVLYTEQILFRLGKNVDYWEEQTAFVIDMVFSIMLKEDKEGIFIYNIDNEICYFNSDGSIRTTDAVGMIERFFRW